MIEEDKKIKEDDFGYYFLDSEKNRVYILKKVLHFKIRECVGCTKS